MTSSSIKIFLNAKLIVFATKWCHFSYFTISFPVGSQTGSWKYVNMEVEYELILSWNFRNNRGRKTTKIGLMYFSISDFEIGGAYSLKGMTFGQSLKVLKVSSDSLLFCLEPVWSYLLTVKSYGQKLFKKIPFFRQFSTLNPSRFL